ncbi:MAG: hypothetical protein V7L05_02905 [Nostoc sp.]|uniref:hypothetical protein n=1 Tax=Nostoc sp. TaxID=1180 RepID=UPI002FF7DD0B
MTDINGLVQLCVTLNSTYAVFLYLITNIYSDKTNKENDWGLVMHPEFVFTYVLNQFQMQSSSPAIHAQEYEYIEGGDE